MENDYLIDIFLDIAKYNDENNYFYIDIEGTRFAVCIEKTTNQYSRIQIIEFDSFTDEHYRCTATQDEMVKLRKELAPAILFYQMKEALTNKVKQEKKSKI